MYLDCQYNQIIIQTLISAGKRLRTLTGANYVIIVERHRKVLETYSFHLSVKNPCA